MHRRGHHARAAVSDLRVNACGNGAYDEVTTPIEHGSESKGKRLVLHILNNIISRYQSYRGYHFTTKNRICRAFLLSGALVNSR